MGAAASNSSSHSAELTLIVFESHGTELFGREICFHITAAAGNAKVWGFYNGRCAVEAVSAGASLRIEEIGTDRCRSTRGTFPPASRTRQAAVGF